MKSHFLTALTTHLMTPVVSDAPALFALIDQDRAHLARWMPRTASIQSVADEAAFLLKSRERIAANQFWLAVIWVGTHPAGTVDLHSFKDGHAEVGYWLGRDFQGRGIMPHVLGIVEDVAFNQLGLNKVELVIATDNTRSQAVAIRRKFHQDAILREHLLTAAGTYDDAIVYSKLKHDGHGRR
ncbi:MULTISPECIES: GNAT family N-acetyltransferase [Lactobacillaceae]|uniref:GNAT family N-acetyltransferase n=1 Tax=Lactobacillaceae TaxID=33958 RepID=UPI0014571DD5|nr:GNAT family protein [Lactobacillus sp. HBUAS51381]NLR08410.1 GNAT family N-acetyltransferase [Lactobacillus sp. HBUAS51381]